MPEAGAEAQAEQVEAAQSERPKRKPAGRPRLREAGGRTKSTGDRESYTNELKLDVVKRLRPTGDSWATINHFWPKLHSVDYENRRKLIGVWKKKMVSLEKACSTTKGKLRTRERKPGTGTILSKPAETEVATWVEDLRKESVPISTLMLSSKADEIAKKYKVKDLHASWSWNQRFKGRHRLSLRSKTRQGQQTPQCLARVRQASAAEVSETMTRLGVSTI